MQETRQNRISRLLQKELSLIFELETRKMRGVMVSVTHVRISPDLSICTAHLSVFPSERGEEILNNIRRNGPNLNMLGVREPGIYGKSSFESYLPQLCKRYPDVEFEYYQSNIEGELINKMQQEGYSVGGIVINAGAYTHTSIALLDCIRSLTSPVVEVHISNVHSREEFRHHSMISSGCVGVIAGFGLDSYRLAVDALIERSRQH